MLKEQAGYLLLSFPNCFSICAYRTEQIGDPERTLNFLQTLLSQLKAEPALWGLSLKYTVFSLSGF